MFRNGALALLVCLVLPQTPLAERVNCKPGEVAYETRRVGEQDVDLLTAGPGCPEGAPEVVPLPPVAVAAAPAAAEQPDAAKLVSDRPEAQAASAGAQPAEQACFLGWFVAGSVVLFVLSAAYGAHRVYDRKVRQPRLQAEEEAKRKAEEQADEELRAAEEGARRAAEAEDARRVAGEVAAAAAQAREEAERQAQEAGRASHAEKERERQRERHQEELRMRETGAEEERRRRELEEADAAARQGAAGRGGGAGGEAAKKRCGPIGCGGCGGAPRVAEPGLTGSPKQ